MFLSGCYLSRRPIHYHPVDCPCGLPPAAFVGAFAALKCDVANELLPVLVPLFPRHRWVGAPDTIDQALLLSYVHHMYSTVVPVWLVCTKTKRQPLASDFDHVLGVGPGDDDLGERGAIVPVVDDSYFPASEVRGLVSSAPGRVG